MQTDVDGLVEEVSIVSPVLPATPAAVGHMQHQLLSVTDLHTGTL